jgi:hypothetical protein
MYFDGQQQQTTHFVGINDEIVPSRSNKIDTRIFERFLILARSFAFEATFGSLHASFSNLSSRRLTLILAV